MTQTHGDKRFILAIDPQSPPEGLESAVVAIGNFDGVHLGHLAVIRRAEALAARLDRPCAVLTFEPHPSDFFQRGRAVFRLSPMQAKARSLKRLGVDGMIVVPFNEALAALPAGHFIEEVLLRRLGVSAVVAGYDFHFGAGRSGTPAFLREAGARLGFSVEIVGRVNAEGAGSAGGDAPTPASSTAIRAALEVGDAAEAARLLGRPYSIVGEVLAGQKLGRELGFPTANIRPDPTCRLRHGIYAVRVDIGGVLHDGVASFGRRPTVDNGEALLEAHVFDFSGDLYGQTLEVFFVGWIRPEEKFASLDALKAQIAADAAKARQMLRASSSP
ncbi:riboflavin biosynthesis protein RibF [Methylocella silvestris BL2]|uniref:Riboflavin biosynthesis protein n=1 Tax=Methylocella silvestris (strain DSM 15510 / CIP 108128 / LMG 27833 / NCIMB 13906 / BL2) TaxID=395965 RepID=B8EP65_METSB|nr:bifunctional riboflavin kinase/FAD synthetase [Methylocella silvestris]ACK49653.1 riboflavin biosynthesis protein RibF [Methylocella silvestris BL2]